MALISKEDLLTKFETGALLFQPEVKRIIKIQPEVDAERVWHGRWIDRYNNGDWHCSVCQAIVEKEEQNYHDWRYCYHCGSKMDGGVE